MKVQLVDQNGTHFASFDMPHLPRIGDHLEIGYPANQGKKLFEVEQVIHKMVQLPTHETKYVEGVPVRCEVEIPWRWDIQLEGRLFDPEELISHDQRKCTCSGTPNAVKCQKHGDQGGGRELCPKCGECYLGYCAAGEYCTDDKCRYVA